MTTESLAEYLALEAQVPQMCDELGLDEDDRTKVRMGVEAIQHWINGNYEWALTSGRYAADKESPAARAELAGHGSLDDLLAV